MNRTTHSIHLPIAMAACLFAPADLSAAISEQQLLAIPFAAKSGSAHRMVFTPVPASESGIAVENPYDDLSMWGEHYTEFQGGAIGTGVAVGDVDGDGLVDVYIVNKARPNRLYRQIKPFRFEDITDRAGVPGGTSWSTGASFADVDDDGDIDLYTCQFDAPNLLYINDGSGVFTEAGQRLGVDLVSGSVVGAFEDYDRDGDLDLFVVTNIRSAAHSPDGEPDFLFRNRGDGSFDDFTEAAGIERIDGRGHSATWSDFNADGWPDLYIANDFAVPDQMYQNNGDGTFTNVLEAAVPHTSWFSMGSDSADINNDGLFDLLVSEMAATTHFKSKVAMGDMGGLVDRMDTLVTPQYMKNTLFLNSRTDRFIEIAKLAGLGSTDWSWSPRFEDLDNDGWVDLHITNGMVRSFIDSDLNNVIKTVQSKRAAIALMKKSPPLLETNLAFRNDGDLHFEKVQADWGLDHTGVSFGSAFADFDNDGDLDLIYANYDATASLFRNDCPTGNSIVVQLQGTTGNSKGIGAQAIAYTDQGTQTRRVTVARGALSSSEPIMHFGLGSSGTLKALEIRWPSGLGQRFEDLPANHRFVVTEPLAPSKPGAATASRSIDHGLLKNRAGDAGIDFVNEEQPFNDMIRQSLLPNRMNTLGGGIARGDVDGDGDFDIYFAGAAGKAGSIYLNDGDGKFARSTASQPWDAKEGVEETAPLFIDIDSDGDMDLLITAGGVEADKGSELYRNTLYLNDGRGSFSEAGQDRMASPPVSSSVACAADFDRDGDLDVFVGGRVVPGEYPTAPQSMLLENRDGSLVDVTDAVCADLRSCGMVTSALWSDADGDGWIDLLVTGEWMTLRVFRNVEGLLTEATTEAGLAEEFGWWNSLAAADVDHDGDIDYIAGNTGLNTKYHASKGHPVSIYYGDFENDGTCEIVEAEYEGDTLYPVRGRSCSSRAMPSIAEKFPTFRDFGAAMLEEIYSDEKLRDSLQLSATQLASGVFLNDGQGHFAFTALPRLAQVAPVFGIAAEDFNADGAVDLFLAQNFRGPQVETGRFDGGISLLLLGDGRGGFAAAAPSQSGIAIPGEGRGVAVGDFDKDGRPDLLLTLINENSMLLAPRAGPANQSFAVNLTGSAGNPDAVGARITIVFASGARQASEIRAGSGYLSQSEPSAFFSHAPHDEPTAILVTWPDGERTSHAFDPGRPRILLRRDT